MRNVKRSIYAAACKLKYPIRDDVPVMLVDEAEPVE
ncbi:MAG: Trm112 family protein [Nitrospinales bacterium]